MGWKYEIYEWWRDNTKGEKYKYHLEYQGDSLIKAIYTMMKLRYNGARCIKIEWRP